MKRPALNVIVCLILATALAAPAGAAPARKSAAPAGKTAARSDKATKGDKPEDKSPYSSGTFSGLAFRNIGPAAFAGRAR